MFDNTDRVTLVGVNGFGRRKKKDGTPYGHPRALRPADAATLAQITDEDGFVRGTSETPAQLSDKEGNLWVSFEATDDNIVESLEKAQPVKGVPMTYVLDVVFRHGIERETDPATGRIFVTVGAVIVAVVSGRLYNASKDGFVVRDKVKKTEAAAAPAAPATGGVAIGADMLELFGNMMGGKQ